VQTPAKVGSEAWICIVLGQKMGQLVNQRQKAGYYRVRLDARDEAGREVAARIYLYRLEAAKFSQSRRVLLLE